jgi:hypothetical protein
LDWKVAISPLKLRAPLAVRGIESRLESGNLARARVVRLEYADHHLEGHLGFPRGGGDFARPGIDFRLLDEVRGARTRCLRRRCGLSALWRASSEHFES